MVSVSVWNGINPPEILPCNFLICPLENLSAGIMDKNGDKDYLQSGLNGIFCSWSWLKWWLREKEEMDQILKLLFSLGKNSAAKPTELTSSCFDDMLPPMCLEYELTRQPCLTNCTFKPYCWHFVNTHVIKATPSFWPFICTKRKYTTPYICKLLFIVMVCNG